MKPKHTPGPWVIVKHEAGYVVHGGTVQDAKAVAEILDCVGETRFNASLIQAAPELLSLLAKARLQVDSELMFKIIDLLQRVAEGK